MEIQWVILAREYWLNEDRTIDIYNIVHGIDLVNYGDPVHLKLIAKVNYLPFEVLSEKHIAIEVEHDKQGWLGALETQHKVLGVEEWATTTPYIGIDLPLKIDYSGKYTISVLIDGERKNEESLDVVYVGD